MERFTLYAIAYAILNSMENLHFDKEGYFHVLVFYGLFYKTNRNTYFNFSFPQNSTRVSTNVWKHGNIFYFLIVVSSKAPLHSCVHRYIKQSQHKKFTYN